MAAVPTPSLAAQRQPQQQHHDRHHQQQQQHRRRRAALLAGLSFGTAAAAAPALASKAGAVAVGFALPSLIQALGVFVLCCAAAAALLASIPALIAAARAANRAEAVLRVRWGAVAVLVGGRGLSRLCCVCM